MFNIYLQFKFQMPNFIGSVMLLIYSRVTPTSQVCAPAMLFLGVVGNVLYSLLMQYSYQIS
jgi:hypothetical protein